MTTLNPYLGFRGTAREAMEFYPGGLRRRTDGVDVRRLRCRGRAGRGRSGDALPADRRRRGRLHGSDTPKHMDYREGSNFSMSLSGSHTDEAQLHEYFERLSDGGTVQQPLSVAPWGDSFGMVQDRFGITWLVNIAPLRRGSRGTHPPGQARRGAAVCPKGAPSLSLSIGPRRHFDRLSDRKRCTRIHSGPRATRSGPRACRRAHEPPSAPVIFSRSLSLSKGSRGPSAPAILPGP